MGYADGLTDIVALVFRGEKRIGTLPCFGDAALTGLGDSPAPWTWLIVALTKN